MNHPLTLDHFALTVGDPDEEIAFHGGVLGLSLLRDEPLAAVGRRARRLTFGIGGEEEAGFLQLLALGADGRPGRLGSNCPKTANLSVPPGSLGFWKERLFDAHLDSQLVRRLGSERLEFLRPDAVGYSLVEDESAGERGDPGEVPPAHAIRGLYSVTLSLMDVRETHEFMVGIFEAEHLEQDLAWGRYRLSADQTAGFVELLHEPYRAPGTWTYAVGTPHHIGIEVGGWEERELLCERLLEVGYRDVSSAEEEGGVSSAWVRAAGGVLIELRVPSGHDGATAAESTWVME